MRNPFISGTAVLFLVLAPAALAESQPPEAEAKQLVKAFVGTMKPLLVSTLQEQGPREAISVCADRAPEIAEELTARTGWAIRRVSLKPRNAAAATPDPWEREQLEAFARQAEAGVPGPELNHGGVVDGRYRYMQAQVTGGVCLVCHGEAIDPAVQAAIEARYPDDTATGYRLGEVRGAVTLRAPAE